VPSSSRSPFDPRVRSTLLSPQTAPRPPAVSGRSVVCVPRGSEGVRGRRRHQGALPSARDHADDLLPLQGDVGGMEVREARKPRALENESRKVKHVVARTGAGLPRKKMATPSSRRKAAGVMIAEFRRRRRRASHAPCSSSLGRKSSAAFRLQRKATHGRSAPKRATSTHCVSRSRA
jgi:hypothetical protein